MTLRSRLIVPACLVAAILGGCGPAAPSGQLAGSETASSPAASATDDPEKLAGYIAGICPVFDALVVLDPQLNELRARAADGGDMGEERESIASLGDGLLVLLNELESLPDWEPGAGLRFQLMNTLHGIRVRLLDVDRDPEAADAATLITGMPFIATEALDRAMSVAAQGGLVCSSGL